MRLKIRKKKLTAKKDLPLTPWEEAQKKRQQKKHFYFWRTSQHRIGNKLPNLMAQRKKRLKTAIIKNFLFFGFWLVVALYFIFPISKVASIEVGHYDNYIGQQIIDISQIKPRTLLISVFLNQSGIEQRIKKQAPEIKKVDFVYTNQEIKLKIKENKNLGYVSKNNHFYRVGLNGKISKIGHKQPNNNVPLYFGFSHLSSRRKMAEQLNKLSFKIVKAISEIHFVPTKSDPERILLYMNDGNQVVATLATFASKMKYYPQIKAQSDQKIKIDFQVGAYSYPLK